MKTAVLVVLGLACLAVAEDFPLCEIEYDCEHTQLIDNVLYYWDFRYVCKDTGSEAGDYHFNDGLGHDYYANICGTSAHKCLPESWVNNLERGVAIQYWGDEPACNKADPSTYKCMEKINEVPACCTKNCQVLGSGKPHITLEQPGQPELGVKMTFTGETPPPDDPYWCPWNPATGGQYARTVHYHLLCAPEVNGAEPFMALQNITNECDYHLTFKSKWACGSKTPIAPYRPPKPASGKMSGGWIFVIIVLVLSVVYLGGGFLYTYHTERVWAPPNRQFWASVGQYTSDGVSFIGSGCKRTGGGGAAGAGPSPYDEIGGSSGSGAGAAYSGSSYNAGSEAPKTAYTDL